MIVCNTDEIRYALPVKRVIDQMCSYLRKEHSEATGKRERLTYSNGEKGWLVSTSGRINDSNGSYSGTRIYHTKANGEENSHDITLLYRDSTGTLECVANGLNLGEMRNGALGAIAARNCINDIKPITVLALGAGRQAYAQLEYIVSVVEIADIYIYCRHTQSFQSIAYKLRKCCRIPIQRVRELESIQNKADVIITATDSLDPVLTSPQLKDTVHINYIGPKKNSGQEVDSAVVDTMDFLLTDSLHQFSLDLEHFSYEFGSRDIIPLVEVVESSRKYSESKTMYVSNCLPGGELVILQAYIETLTDRKRD